MTFKTPKPLPMRARLAVVPIGVILICAAAAVSASQRHDSNPPGPTRVARYVPPTDLAAADATGSCWNASVASPSRADAIRCVVAGTTFDPCFTTGRHGVVICDVDPRKPGSGRVVKVQSAPAQELDRSGPSTMAWFVELADGTVCRPMIGPGRPIDPEIELYSCKFADLADASAAILGELEDREPIWTVRKAGLTKSVVPHKIKWMAVVAVRAVWQ